jgi:hypothetical protein
MDEEQFYSSMQRMLETLPSNFNILEEKIDIDVQMAYFDNSEKTRARKISKACFKEREQLFLPEIPLERKKEILSSIAIIDDVKAYRTIEKYVEVAEPELKQWAILAMQESRMLLQSSLLDEQQVFISTGLGGKNKKLRYFVVFINVTEDKLDKMQKKLLKDELIYKIKNSDGELESVKFLNGFSTALIVLPLSANIRDIFRAVIDECNQFGNFLNEDMIITNVKELTRKEIIRLLHENKSKNPDHSPEG